MSTRTTVGVLYGGRSAEHEVSLQSAQNVIAALDTEKYEIVPIYIDRAGQWYLVTPADVLAHSDTPRSGEPVVLPPGKNGQLVSLHTGQELARVDVVFPVLHGPHGEDGTVQGLLKLANVPFVGADVLGSAVGMDKEIMKRLLREAGIPLANYRVLRHAQSFDVTALATELGLPVFVKPANLGSSVGVSKATTAAELEQAIAAAFQYDTKVIVEEAIVGREIECAVLGNDEPVASVPGEIIPHDDFYSYEAKYIDENGAGLHIPADLSDAVVKQIQDMAVHVFQTLECAGLGRVDVFLEESGDLKVIEINTIPGFTKISMYPQLWEASGVPYPTLITRLIELALSRFHQTHDRHPSPAADERPDQFR